MTTRSPWLRLADELAVRQWIRMAEESSRTGGAPLGERSAGRADTEEEKRDGEERRGPGMGADP